MFAIQAYWQKVYYICKVTPSTADLTCSDAVTVFAKFLAILLNTESLTPENLAFSALRIS